MIALWMAVLVFNGAYGRNRLGAGTSEYAKVIFASGMTAGRSASSATSPASTSRAGSSCCSSRSVCRACCCGATPPGAWCTWPTGTATSPRGCCSPVPRARRRRRHGARTRVVARLPHRRRSRARRGHRLATAAACPWSAPRPTRRGPPSTTRPTSWCSPRAPTRPPPTSAGSPGTSRAGTCRWPSCPASATSRPAGSRCARSEGCRWCTWRSRRASARRAALKRLFDIVGAPRCLLLASPLLARVRPAIKIGRPRAGALPPDPGRPRRAAVRVPEVPLHGGRRRGQLWHQPPEPERGGRAVQDAARPADHPRRAASSAATRSTSCRSWSTCCAAT